MKKISVIIPAYNEYENVEPLSQAIIGEMKKLDTYDYEIVFIDNDSQDGTREKLRMLCQNNSKIKAIFNAKNFGPGNSGFYGLLQTTGDCSICMCADFQEPVELIPVFVKEWEAGYKIVTAIKSKSKENPIMRFVRTCYYRLIRKFSDIEQIEHFTGFGLYDRSFVEILRKLDDPIPFFRGMVAEFGFKRKEIYYEQQKRKAGKSKNNFYTLYDLAMLSFTSYTTVGLRLISFLGFGISFLCVIIAIIYLILKLLYWDTFIMGTAPMLIGMFLLGAIQLISIGFLGEYILCINKRVMNRPLVIEEERLNFDDD